PDRRGATPPQQGGIDLFEHADRNRGNKLEGGPIADLPLGSRSPLVGILFQVVDMAQDAIHPGKGSDFRRAPGWHVFSVSGRIPATAMNLIDAVIVLAVGLGVYIGWSRGLLGPLLAEATFLISYWVVLTHPGLVSSLTPAGVPRPLAMIGLPVVLALAVGVIGGMVLGAVFRIPLTRQLDKVLGAAVNGGVAFVIVYVLLLGLVGAGTVLGPITRAGLIGSSQVGVMRTLLSQYPQAAGVVPPGELVQLASATSTHPIPFADLSQYAKVIDYYEHDLRPALASSQLAPLVLRLGSHIPVIGRPVTVPKAVRHALAAP